MIPLYVLKAGEVKRNKITGGIEISGWEVSLNKNDASKAIDCLFISENADEDKDLYNALSTISDQTAIKELGSLKKAIHKLLIFDTPTKKFRAKCPK